MSKSTTGQAQTCELAYFWAKIDIGSVPAAYLPIVVVLVQSSH